LNPAVLLEVRLLIDRAYWLRRLAAMRALIAKSRGDA
jgi:hypothetical protein